VSCGRRAAIRVIYLVFTEGYSASEGASLTRQDLSAEAIRLGRLLVELLPEPETVGLLLGSRRHLRNAGVADLRLGPDDALGNRWRGGQESACNFLSGEAADFAQRERDLGLRRQGWMTADENQA
jgi:hypothetical protein